MDTPTDIQQVISALKATYSEEKIAALVYDQLVKDFNTAGLAIPFSAETDHRQWGSEILKILAAAPDQKLAVLLYSVDIPEKMTRNIHNTEAFASLILYREFVKIYFRLNYNPPS